ncbi:MAG: hypothetical protein DRJ52_02765 [Thermoprotei archaeon]|nr:MAG: hypothetical protein DRJ52_02765 [Thermoprotei archaeon]RLF00177.1 MAG: hypothetical protein DRJ63_03120 [Thermoprotei archaeon]HDI75290.1 hypothetical protein [Thermoprotei archaeon]
MCVRKVEVAIVAIMALAYVASVKFLSREVSITVGFILGIYLVFRASEAAVEGLDKLALKAGLSKHLAGVISSIASNLTEALVALFLIMKESAETVETAVLSAIISAGLNVLLLGVLIIILSYKRGAVFVSKSAIRHESDLIRSTVIVCSLITVMGLVEDCKGYLPKGIGVFLLLVYLAYLINMFVSQEKKETKAEYSYKKISLLLALGFGGIIAGSKLISDLGEYAVHTLNLSPALAALILAVFGTVPEHGVAMVGAAKGYLEIGLANLLAGVTQCVLIVLGLVALLTPIPLDGYTVFQLASVAGALWLVNKAILDDEKLTLEEGVFIVLLQVLILVLFEELRF